MRRFNLFLLFFLFTGASFAQELNARVTVISNRVGNNVNQNVFRTLQTALYNFVNTRKWTNDNFLPNEKIECSFLLNLESTSDLNVYNASLTIQAARPVYNTTYLSPIINFKDDNVAFKYVEFQQFEFNENRVSGTDALVSNLTAVFAYYVNMILAFDYDSFSPRGGDLYFQKAQNIVNNAPDGRNISGWKAFDGVRNRYWLVENMLNSRYTIMHDVYYNYYRSGMDRLYDDEVNARGEVLNALNLINNFNTDNPNKMISQFFFQGKSDELIRIFSKAPQQDKARASELLQRLDITNATKYKDQLK
ncbi:MAG: DUF4835 family protein [Chitinophagaceae bacterium]|nr:DUF4835 family protein [Chitinophagaceae bacterium]MBL0056055.1 DUF4835 family protein [Chitinophagaceae bacterium]